MGVSAEDVNDGNRFEIRGSLGSGGMGVVYRVHDRRLGREIALKVLRQGSAAALYRFKREFRAIAGILHPNLVTLHELHTTGGEWFFTMELVDGVPFIEWVRPGDSPPPALPRRDGDPSGETVTIPASELGGHASASDDLDLDRLRPALAQLVDGVLALHMCGKLHRDIKPSNVLVTHEGRVVLLDFGLTSDVENVHADRTHERSAVGTPAYMSPEQARDQPLTEASDWYSVGVILYEALTGRRPLEGTTDEMLRDKQREVALRPSDLDPSVPPDLDALCMRLLALDPKHRPDGRAILSVLGRVPSPATLDLEHATSSENFVGRHDELAGLRIAFRDSHQHGVTVLISGESGIGKSRLARRFLEAIDRDVILLEGRCYESESVPFRTLDAVIDALTAVLLGLSEEEQRAIIPRDAAWLARLFPVMQRVPLLSEWGVGIRRAPNPQELRRRAFDALHAILSGLAAQRPLVIVIDDLQWGDPDSAVFLAELARYPQPRPLLLLLIHRPEDDAGIVSTVRTPRPGFTEGDLRTMVLGPLGDDDARELVRSFGSSTATTELLTREAGGHPLFLAELARSSGRRGESTSLEQLIRDRLDALPVPAAMLLRAVAVAARPLPLDQAALAAGLSGPTAELATLRAERLARIRVDDSDITAIEAYHDRVRAAVVTTMTPDELRETHAALARAYETAGGDEDREALVAHWMAAGVPEKAAVYAAEAARFAEAALAFHRAADLYALALAHGGSQGSERALLHRRYAEALTGAGRLDEAVQAFADAAAEAPAEEALELDTRRLEQLLRRGRLDEGLELSRRLLAGIGIKLPTTRAGAIRAVIVQLLRLRLRGLGFTERNAAILPREHLRKVDLLYSASTGLALVDPVTGRLVQCHHLRAALETGEPRRACSALALELGYLGEGGTRAARRIEAMATRVRDLADRIGDPYVQGRATTMRGFVAFLLGCWRDAALLAEAGLDQMQQHGVGVRWDFDIIEDMHLASLNYMGETREVVRLAPLRLRDAMERGDAFAMGDLRGGRGNIAWLIMGKPDEARAHVEAVRVPPARPQDLQLRHFDQLSSDAQIDLYQGDGAVAWARLEAGWPAIEASLMLRVQILRIEGTFLRARAALAAATGATPPERARLIDIAGKLARRLHRERAAWADAFALQLRATAAMLKGDSREAAVRLDEAERAYTGCDMRLHATVVRLRKGELEGGTTGAMLAASARNTMREQAIADPDAMARLLCPWPE